MKDDMKKLLLLFSLTLMSISAAAQMMPDSTVQFVAYWDVGDKQAYNVSTSEYKVSESDTTEVEYSTEIRMFEVLAKTDSTYKLAVTYKDVHYSDPQMNLLYQIMTETSGDMKVILTTDQHGSIKSIDNLEELVSHQMKVVEPFMEMLGNEEGAELDEQTEAALKDYIVQTFSDPSIIEKSVYDEVGRMLYFHGNRLDMDKEYSGEIDAESIIPGMEAPIKAQTRVWIDTDYTDAYSAVGRIYTFIDNDTLLDYVVEYVKNLMSITGMSQEEIEKEVNESKDAIEQTALSSEEYTVVEVHMDTGWPLNVYYSRYINSKVEGETTQKVKKTDVEIIISE